MSTGENFLVAEAQLVLDQARKEKAEQIKSLGEPIELPGKALAIEIDDNVAWIAENTTVVRKVDLESGKTLRLFRGHTGPVTSLAFHTNVSDLGREDILITGSWDRSIRLWNTKIGRVISVTPDAHSDFVKTLYVFRSLRLLVSGSSDKIVRFWDLSHSESSDPLQSLGSLSSHTRPVECLDGQALSDDTAVLYTGDTMGIIKVWNLQKNTSSERWTATLRDTIDHHRTRINEIRYGNGQLWTASADETVRVISVGTKDGEKLTKPPGPIKHPMPVRAILPLMLTDLSEPYLISAAGDVLRTYEVSSLQEPELLSEIDGHWHDITSIRLWMRRLEGGGRKRIEPWIVTTSLDMTIRKWKLADLLNPPPASKIVEKVPEVPAAGVLSEEEERELEELMMGLLDFRPVYYMASCSSSTATCPVDHSSQHASCPVDHTKNPPTTVDHSTRSNWVRFLSSFSSSNGTPHIGLSQDREVSSIPKSTDGKWVYPSEAQFFAAMTRKNHNPNAVDMKTVVPIHNAVNERTWGEILKWEAGKGGDTCGGVRLVNFKGRPGDKSPKARLNMLLGYSAPFDRHDWVVERCGTHVRYIIDFYAGRSTNKGDMSFYLDVRPALDNWEGVKMRLEGLWKSWSS